MDKQTQLKIIECIFILGLIAISCYTLIASDGKYGGGWGLIAFLLLFLF